MSASLPDLLKPGLDAVFCGINPGKCAADIGHHFHGASNRFWKAIYKAGFTPEQLTAVEDARLLDYGYGLTAAVPRASRSASDVTATELQLGLGDLELKVRQWKPRVIAFLGKPAWTVHTRGAPVKWGKQVLNFGNAEVWVLPNPSGLNRHFSLDQLVLAYRELRRSLDAKLGREHTP